MLFFGATFANFKLSTKMVTLQIKSNYLKTSQKSILTWRGGKLWSTRQFLQGEAAPLHYGVVDPCDFPKCGKLERVIFVSGDLRSR